MYDSAARERFFSEVAFCQHGLRCRNCCWLWTGATNSRGYGRTTIDGRQRPVTHVIVEIIFYRFQTPMPGGVHIQHVPGCPHRHCVQPAHLLLYPRTHAKNMRDIVLARGGARLTVDQVREIRKLYAAGGYTHRAIAALYGTARETVTRIITRHTWKNID